MRLSAKERSRNPLDEVRMRQFERERKQKRSIKFEQPSRGKMHYVRRNDWQNADKSKKVEGQPNGSPSFLCFKSLSNCIGRKSIKNKIVVKNRQLNRISIKNNY